MERCKVARGGSAGMEQRRLCDRGASKELGVKVLAVPPTLLTIANEVVEPGWPTSGSAQTRRAAMSTLPPLLEHERT